MHIVLTPLQFISMSFGLALLGYFWGARSERRFLQTLIKGLEQKLQNDFIKMFENQFS